MSIAEIVTRVYRYDITYISTNVKLPWQYPEFGGSVGEGKRKERHIRGRVKRERESHRRGDGERAGRGEVRRGEGEG